MILRIILLSCCLLRTLAGFWFGDNKNEHECLTGYMTDVQSWVNADGTLNKFYVDINMAIDISYNVNPVPTLQQTLSNLRTAKYYVKYLSMAMCSLNRIPLIFHLRDGVHRHLSDTVEYMSFYGNNFVTFEHAGKEYDVFFNATGATETILSQFPDQKNAPSWSSSLETARFSRLKELDLRACFIQILNPKMFQGMRKLQALYIGENEIFQISAEAFVGLENLYHLDFSKNHPLDRNGHPQNLILSEFYTFQNLTNLVSLDLSNTKLTPSNIGMIESLGKTLKSLSLCDTALLSLPSGILKKTSLEILDISRNNGILLSDSSLSGLENSLTVLSAKDIGLQTIDIFGNFTKLEILQLSGNEISHLTGKTTRTLKSLQILDLDKNRLPSWFNATFSLMPNLRLLSLRENNLNIISEEMIQDLRDVEYLALSANFIICNCNVKDFYRMAAMNELKYNDSRIEPSKKNLYNLGYEYYNNIIYLRMPVTYTSEAGMYEEIVNTGKFRLIDYDPELYTCFKFVESVSQQFSEVTGCNVILREEDYESKLNTERNLLFMLLLIPSVLLPILFSFIFRRNLRYFIITMRNSATLSLINKDEVVEENKIYNYDVFVSYCNEDRGWVLDHLLPHIETDYSVSACLHERDFQVGLSILENIVSCMDRSRSIMLILSRKFLLSQWCQFEMHLAQHRLLETRREDLILVLLEDIPRRLRPNTLHYLMLTKTYIVWPKANISSERAIFWKRLKKSLISQKIKPLENSSLA